MREMFDYIVIGAGMMGSAAARHLSLAGASVALVGLREPVDAAGHIGPFASHHDAARITRKLDRNGDWSKLSARSIARYRVLEAETGIRFFHETGAIMVASPRHGVPGVGPALRAVDRAERVGAAMLDGCAARGLFPFFAFEDGALVAHEAQDAGYINPRALVRAEIASAVARGAVWIDGAVAEIAGGSVRLTDGRQVEGGAVVLAAGAYSGLSGLIAVQPRLEVFARTILFAEIDEAESARLRDMPSVVAFPQGTNRDVYVLPPVTYPDGRTYLKIGGDPVDVALSSPEAVNTWFRTEGSASVGAGLLETLRAMMPGLRVRAHHTGACVTAFTSTGLPMIYRADASTVVLTGGNGAGAKCADEIGRLGAIVAMGGSLAEEGYAGDFGPGPESV